MTELTQGAVAIGKNVEVGYREVLLSTVYSVTQYIR